MKKLMVWGYSSQSLDELAKRKVPKVSLGEVGISEVFNPKKTHPDFDFPWSWFVKGQEIPPMPEKVYVCLKKARSVTFDFLPYGYNFFIMSARFLEFIKKYGFDHDFGMSEAIIVNTKGELLTNEVYYLVRIVSWEIEDEIVYPDLGRDGLVRSLIMSKDVYVYDITGLLICLGRQPPLAGSPPGRKIYLSLHRSRQLRTPGTGTQLFITESFHRDKEQTDAHDKFREVY